jgi:hypothetical protein
VLPLRIASRAFCLNLVGYAIGIVYLALLGLSSALAIFMLTSLG